MNVRVGPFYDIERKATIFFNVDNNGCVQSLTRMASNNNSVTDKLAGSRSNFYVFDMTYHQHYCIAIDDNRSMIRFPYLRDGRFIRGNIYIDGDWQVRNYEPSVYGVALAMTRLTADEQKAITEGSPQEQLTPVVPLQPPLEDHWKNEAIKTLDSREVPTDLMSVEFFNDFAELKSQSRSREEYVTALMAVKRGTTNNLPADMSIDTKTCAGALRDYLLPDKIKARNDVYKLKSMLDAAIGYIQATIDLEIQKYSSNCVMDEVPLSSPMTAQISSGLDHTRAYHLLEKECKRYEIYIKKLDDNKHDVTERKAALDQLQLSFPSDNGKNVSTEAIKNRVDLFIGTFKHHEATFQASHDPETRWFVKAIQFILHNILLAIPSAIQSKWERDTFAFWKSSDTLFVERVNQILTPTVKNTISLREAQ